MQVQCIRKVTCTQATVCRFGWQYRNCRYSVLLLCDISLYSAVNQQLICNTGKVLNCLNQFYLVWFFRLRNVFFLLNTSFEKAIDAPIQGRNNMLKNSQKHLYLIAAKCAVYCDRPRTLSKLNTAMTVHKKHLTSRSTKSVCK